MTKSTTAVDDTDRTVGTILSMLADPDRRAILSYLATAPNQRHTVEAIVAHLDKTRPGSDTYHRSRFAHVHGPRLEAAGLIVYDRQAGTITYQPTPQVEACLNSALECEEHL